MEKIKPKIYFLKFLNSKNLIYLNKKYIKIYLNQNTILCINIQLLITKEIFQFKIIFLYWELYFQIGN